MKFWSLYVLLLFNAASSQATEEHLRGVLEKTVKPGACAQITDALRETYFINNTPDAQKITQDMLGKRVMLTGIVEQHAGDPDYFFKLNKAEPLDKPESALAPPSPLPVNGGENTGTNVPLAPPPEKK